MKELKKITIIGAGLIIVLVVLFIFTDIFSTKTVKAWYTTGGTWTNRKAITIDYTKVPNTDQTDFPVLIDITDSGLQVSAQADGDDILFTSADGSTKLAHEIEVYTSATGRLTAWVKVPTLSYTTNTVIYMYYGNSGASNQQNATGVWDSNYKGVWHLPNGTTLTANDSTSNANHATITGSSAAAGKIEGAANFANSGDRLTITSISLSGGVYTISTWFKTPFPTTGYTTLTRGASDHQVLTEATTRLLGVYDNVGSTGFHSSGFDVSTLGNGWHYLTAITSGSNTVFYIDGSSVGTSNWHSAQDIVSLGNYQGGAQQWGYTDELRISTGISRSANWIKTEYNNQSATSTFYSIGSSEAVPPEVRPVGVPGVKLFSTTTTAGLPGWYSGAWGYRKKIAIDPQKVGSTTASYLNNFPMLVSVIDPELKVTGSGGKVASSTAGDIIFTGADGTTLLNYEIEKYTSTTGELVAWVKVPFVSSTTTTPIYMYVGNASAPNVSASTWQNVWDSNFKVVMHMSDNSANTTIVNSLGSNNAANQANTSTKTQTGKVGGALNFNGSSDWAVTGNFTLAGTETFSAWVNSDVASNYAARILETNYTLTGSLGVTDACCTYTSYNTTINNISGSVSGGTINVGNWQYITGTHNGTTVTLYVDGVRVNSVNVGSPGSNSLPLYIARYYGSPAFFWQGKIDEARVSDSARSSDWIMTEYSNQSNPSTFYSYGGLENYNGRVNSSGAVVPAVKVRGGVKFR